jgi:pyruvate/2-oxoglutarate/acetoin dehydrogenase E1 component
MPYSRKIEKLCIPRKETIIQAVKDVTSGGY